MSFVDLRNVTPLSAQDRSRTGTSFSSLVFETSATTNSATWAGMPQIYPQFALKLLYFFCLLSLSPQINEFTQAL